MTIEIVHRYTRAVLYRSESVADLKAAVIEAVAKRADLGGADLGGAYLVGADLGGADLGGAYLVGAYLVGAYLVGAYLVGANLGGANLGGANLVGANLVGADLGGADLGGADLVGAEIAAGEIASVVGTGHLLGYTWAAYAMKDGTLILRYGCEEHTVAEWREQNVALAERHAGEDERERYVGALTALFALVETAAGSAK